MRMSWRRASVLAATAALTDSDGWYDHAYSGVTNPSAGAGDALTGAGLCGTGTPLAGQDGRCGLGLPLLVISPWAKTNHVDHTLTNQASITRFIEGNWGLPSISGGFDSISGSLNHLFDFDRHREGHGDRGTLFLSPATGEPAFW
jgi:phospholipase C